MTERNLDRTEATHGDSGDSAICTALGDWEPGFDVRKQVFHNVVFVAVRGGVYRVDVIRVVALGMTRTKLASLNHATSE